jgi:LPS-assembly protein
VDVALGATNVPLPRKLLNLLSICFWLVLLTTSAFAAGEEKALHTSGDQSFWDRKHNKVTLIGHAVVRQEGETLTADDMTLDFNTRILDAKGHCVYVTMDSVIYGDEMHLNLDTRTGVVVGARVSNDRFTLAGERINKLAEGRFQVHWGDYSTCKDCPNSWSLEAEDIDITFGGYAFMSNVLSKIEDAPAFWLPYLIVPIKTERQTGFLFPTYHISRTDGFAFVEPFFWAINRSSDMTIGLGDYTARGTRAELEGRYNLAPRSNAVADFDYIDDKTFSPNQNRWAFNIFQIQQLPFGIDEKLKFNEVSDNHYPVDFGNDVNNLAQNQFLASNLIFNYGSSDVSAFIELNRYRNLLPADPNPEIINPLADPNRYASTFDPMTVQLYPAASITTNDRSILGTPVVGGMTLGLYNFTRSGGLYDYDPLHATACQAGGILQGSYTCSSTLPGATPVFQPSIDPIREATRLSVTPKVYTTFRPFDVFELIPSATFYSYFYSFHDGQVNNLNRDYLLLQLDLSTQLEKIWDTPDPDRPKQKNLIRPVLEYSNIPIIRESDPNHPFLQQIQYAQSHNVAGYNFDDYDVVPVNNSPTQTNYFTPLGNSLNLGVTTQLITRNGAIDKPNPTYLQNVEFSMGEAINFKQFENGPGQQQPWSRYFANLNVNADRFQSSSTYYYYPYLVYPRNYINTSETFIIERALKDRVLTYDRSVSLNYVYDCRTPSIDSTSGKLICNADSISANLSFSITDYFLPTAYVAYDYNYMKVNQLGGALTFQSPAQCYKFGISTDYSIQNNNLSFGFDISLNITGNGFGVTQNGTSPTSSGNGPPTGM